MFILKKKGRPENMTNGRRRIRAPAKILVGLRFKHKCPNCSKIIPSDRMVCNKCSRKMRI